VAQTIDDNRGLSLAWGYLGQFYENQADYQPAIEYTLQGIFAARQALAMDSLSQWQWQAGRLYQALGEQEKASLAYDAAISSLQEIRVSLIRASQDYQLDWGEQIEPIYREYLSLLLQSDSPVKLQKALDVLELLQLAELEDYFGDPCLESAPLAAKTVLEQTQALAIYAVILPETSYMIVQTPTGLKKSRVAIPTEQLRQKVTQWRNLLEDANSE
jgi:tetratricopeptide (TPR) repeat protein